MLRVELARHHSITNRFRSGRCRQELFQLSARRSKAPVEPNLHRGLARRKSRVKFREFIARQTNGLFHKDVTDSPPTPPSLACACVTMSVAMISAADLSSAEKLPRRSVVAVLEIKLGFDVIRAERRLIDHGPKRDLTLLNGAATWCARNFRRRSHRGRRRARPV